MPNLTNYAMLVEIDGFPADTFTVARWFCSEGLSRLTLIDVLAHAPLDVDTRAMLKKNARVMVEMESMFSNGARARVTEIPAFVTAVEIDAADHDRGRCTLQLTLQSRVFLTTLVQRTRIFLDKSVRAIIKEVLEGDEFIEGDDFEFKLKGSYDPYEYTVQYQETDFDFISRLMEDEGIYYYISDRYLGARKDAELKDFLVILDSHEFHPEREAREWTGGADVPYRPANPTNPGGEAIGTLSLRHAVLPRDVLLKDYNYRKPRVEMTGAAPAARDGFGTFYSYGDHFRTPDEGAALAAIRAEEILCRVRTWHGTSGVPDLEPALTFNLADHPISEWNGRYTIVSVEHTGQQAAAGVAPQDVSDDIGYHNSFTAIRADTQWRPARATPRPKIFGVMHATIDASASGQYAEIDELGRYKVKVPFDLSDARDGKGSRFMRMAQPYSGAQYGMHFPLHKGVEVLLAHLDGDPDRPIIVGSVPNPDTGSPVTAGNNTQCVIHTGGGNNITFEDTEGTQRIALSSPTSNTFLTMGAARA